MDRIEFERIVPELRLKMLKVALFYLADDNEAEDIVQDALLKLWMARDKINKLR
ncbi:MAG: sigma-70 family RNA polymerase sigma factor, partial [Bacteroidaceae bacterium]|nr:sigma-70 family RNA polymerase sigma factor [Bacteroidaceae bacterium]